MGLIDEFAGAVADAVTELKDRAQDARDVAKLQYEYRSKEREIRSAYESLGRVFYEENKDNNDNEDISTINQALNRMSAIEDELAEIKGTIECPECAATNGTDFVYCCKCGAKLHPAEPVEAEVVEDESIEDEPAAEVVEDETAKKASEEATEEVKETKKTKKKN